jgi:hypothetical protein
MQANPRQRYASAWLSILLIPLHVLAAQSDGTPSSSSSLWQALGAPAAAPASVQPPAPAPVPVPTAAPAQAPTPLRIKALGPGVLTPLRQEQLQRRRGGTDTISNEATLSGVVTGNASVNVTSGANVIQGASFANASGMPTVIQNSGSNVLIQNATVINLQIK